MQNASNKRCPVNFLAQLTWITRGYFNRNCVFAKIVRNLNAPKQTYDDYPFIHKWHESRRKQTSRYSDPTIRSNYSDKREMYNISLMGHLYLCIPFICISDYIYISLFKYWSLSSASDFLKYKWPMKQNKYTRTSTYTIIMINT